MTITLHIKRPPQDGERGEIKLEEWRSAVANQQGMRLSESDATAMNPVTGEAIVIPNRGGDAEVWREDCQDWLRTFWWSPLGWITFPAPVDGNDPTLKMARKLAEVLEADLLDDEGSPISDQGPARA